MPMQRGAGQRPRGFALLAVLIVVAAMGASLAATGTVWHQVQRRANERELLFVGMQYRNAIGRYYNNSTTHAYPPTLAALLRDERLPSVQRYLRRPYRDPLTNSTTWGLVPAPGGGIMGVYSLAKGRPLKQANFPFELGWPGGKASYADWQFVYVPPSG
ncbi:MAG: type II secretion system protein [Rhodocyclaceae bacterium]|nr:type II secretion system protein [Rhodocyclaceae bacterium]